MPLNLDFETRSELDLTRVGAEKYARHPSTRVLCASYSLDGHAVRRWRPWAGEEMPITLKKALLTDDVIIRAWNAAFERQILKHVVKIPVEPRRFRCTQARARSMALPAKLEMCARALNMPIQKGDNRIMMKWCKPLPGGGWADSREEYEELCGYCDVDVQTEDGIGDLLRELTPEEQRDWEITEAINDNGIPIDMELIRAAQRYANDEMDEIRQRLSDLTGKVITSPKQFQRLKDWLAPEIEVDSLDASTREELLDDPAIQGDVREVIQLVHDGGRASTAKFAAMESRADQHGRVHGAYIFNGAGQTGRFSSTGAQLHNFIREKLENTEDVVDAIFAGRSKSELTALSGYNVLTTLSRLLRPSIVAPDGKTLVWGDWKSIEARVLPWLSLENSASSLLALFAAGADVYRHQAAGMFGVAPEDVTDAQRQRGKVAILSLGYGGGAFALIAMARNYGLIIDEDTAEMYKTAWRRDNPWATRYWRVLEAAIFNAVRNPGQAFHAGRVQYMSTEAVLWCLLPCGRMIAYPFPRIESTPGRYGPADTVTCIKGAWSPKKGQKNWPRMSLWGGLAAENITQGTAASLLRWSQRELADNGWLECMVGHTHDENMLEVPDEEVPAAREVLEDVMVQGPPWAMGLPLAIDMFSGVVYGK